MEQAHGYLHAMVAQASILGVQSKQVNGMCRDLNKQAIAFMQHEVKAIVERQKHDAIVVTADCKSRKLANLQEYKL